MLAGNWSVCVTLPPRGRSRRTSRTRPRETLSSPKPAGELMQNGELPGDGEPPVSTARRAAVISIVVVAVVAAALALWKLRLVITLLFLAIVIASAMRPGVEALRRRRVPSGVGVVLHYLAMLTIVGLFLWLALPHAVSQLESAVGNVPTSSAALKHAASHTSGIKHEILVAIEKRLQKLPSGAGVIHPAVSVGKKAFEVLIGIFFVFATAAYWVLERDRAVDLVTSLLARPKRKRVRDTWDLIDARLGAFVRGQLLLILFVATVL